MGHTTYSYNSPYGILRVFYRIELIGPYHTIANLPIFLPFLGIFRPNNGLLVSFQCYYIIYYNT